MREGSIEVKVEIIRENRKQKARLVVTQQGYHDNVLELDPDQALRLSDILANEAQRAKYALAALESDQP